MTSRRRLTPWWRLLVAICVVAVPAAAAASLDPGMWRHTARHPAHLQVQAGRVAGAVTSRAVAADHVGARHHTWPAADGLAGLVIAGVWGFAVMARRRAGRVTAGSQQLLRTRAPPEETDVLVPSGHSPGPAGRFSRRSLAPFRPRTCTALG